MEAVEALGIYIEKDQINNEYYVHGVGRIDVDKKGIASFIPFRAETKLHYGFYRDYMDSYNKNHYTMAEFMDDIKEKNPQEDFNFLYGGWEDNIQTGFLMSGDTNVVAFLTYDFDNRQFNIRPITKEDMVGYDI